LKPDGQIRPYNISKSNGMDLTTTAKLWYIELQYFKLPVLSNNGKWPGNNQCK